MPFSSDANQILGECESDGSPVVAIELMIGTKRVTLACNVDTGCGDDVVFTDYTMAARNGLQFDIADDAPRVRRFLPNGTFAFFLPANATINWFGPREVIVLAPDPKTTTSIPINVPSSEIPAPRILIGLPLLKETSLTVDFTGQPGLVRIVSMGTGQEPEA